MKLKDSLAATFFYSSPVLFFARKVIKYAAIAYVSIFAYVATSSFSVIHLETESFLGTDHKVFIEASPQQIHAAINADALHYGVIGAIYAAIWFALIYWGIRLVKRFAKTVIAERRAAKEVAA